MTNEAAKYDVVLQIVSVLLVLSRNLSLTLLPQADIFNLPATAAFLAGAKKRFEATGKAPIYIHTSGTGIWADLGSNGGAPSGKITKDTDADLVATYNALPHSPPAKAVVDAAAAGYVKTFTIYPPTVWGAPSGPLFDAGIAHVGSIQLPLSIKTSIGRGQGGVVGEGLNVWNHAHVDDSTCIFSSVPATIANHYLQPLLST